MIKTLISLSFILLISSCGVKEEFEFINEPTTGDPILLNEDSRSNDTLYSLGGVSRGLQREVFSGNPLCASSELVLRTYKSGSFGWKSIKNWLYETVLRKSSLYKKDKCDDMAEPGTYEHAASTILNQMQKTELLLKDQTNLNLSKVTVRVVPLIKQKLRRVEGRVVTSRDDYLVNNAFFLPQRKELVFVPQGLDRNGNIPYDGVQLWNIPFVVSHEYGHHIFNELLGDKANKKAHICFNTNSSDNYKGQVQSISNLKLMSAINEGFADIVGQLSSSEDFSFNGISGFSMSRDLKSEYFYSGSSKNLTSNRLNEELTSSRKFDPHHLGAMIAYGIYSTMQDNDISNFKVLVNWAKAMKQAYELHKTVKNNFNDMISSFVKGNLNLESFNRKEVCNSLNLYFSGLDLDQVCK